MLKNWCLGCAALLALVMAAVPAQAQRGERFEPPPSGVFEFVGFSTGTVDGGVGTPAIAATCQADFGPDTRMCTSEEYFRSPGAVAPGDDPAAWAWVHPSRQPHPSVQADFAGRTLPVGFQSCKAWDSNFADQTGLIIVFRGGRSNGTCDVARPVTCCARLQ